MSTALRTARVAAIEGNIGASPKIKLFSLGGVAAPANCAAADVGVVLCTIDLPADWLTTAAAGAVSKNGTWSGVNTATGVADFFRLYASDGTTCHMQGTAGTAGVDLVLSSDTLYNGFDTNVIAFSISDGNG